MPLTSLGGSLVLAYWHVPDPRPILFYPSRDGIVNEVFSFLGQIGELLSVVAFSQHRRSPNSSGRGLLFDASNPRVDHHFQFIQR